MSISKLGVLALFGVLLCVAAAPRLYAADPTVTIALYAARQEQSPLQIVGFKYGIGNIYIEVSNTSSKPIVGSRIFAVVLSPSECPIEKTGITMRLGDTLSPLRIAPHSKGITSGKFSPGVLIMSAKDLGAGGYLHVQVGVVQVDFADGTVWKWGEGLPLSGPFDVTLLHSDRVRCPNAADVRKAFASVRDVDFNSQIVFREPADERSRESDAVPRLAFVCTLHESSAVCPWPARK
jgi:hypothetical protein